MDDAFLVRGFEGRRDLYGDGDRSVYRKPTAGNAGCERVADGELHDEHRRRGRAFQPMDRSDIGMIQRSEDARFAFEAREALGICGEGIGKDLDRDVAMEVRVTGAIDLAHAAGSERRNDLERSDARPIGQHQRVEIGRRALYAATYFEWIWPSASDHCDRDLRRDAEIAEGRRPPPADRRDLWLRSRGRRCSVPVRQQAGGHEQAGSLSPPGFSQPRAPSPTRFRPAGPTSSRSPPSFPQPPTHT